MNVKELRNILDQLPESYDYAEVILQKDPEANGFFPLHGVDFGVWEARDYDVIPDTCSAEDLGMEEDEWEFLKTKSRCIVLLP